ncbi:hypothetical protein NEOLI_000993 [Neolecta irregularis DAH-3]|uniref:Uncharacterized protein n=1 Tax=Neolecta irregularis (strain DAH-3) TaxID=1198029 RepID=A0A1U7LH85_NEOID|nr:hypothetical protein NEOLI_000993 [Neolecta irregularis DAH-3]|eukprot:OLL21891.1 hypothetical protein NEOLI_000993 [Neolecta irregularis DAH-3]
MSAIHWSSSLGYTLTATLESYSNTTRTITSSSTAALEIASMADEQPNYFLRNDDADEAVSQIYPDRPAFLYLDDLAAERRRYLAVKTRRAERGRLHGHTVEEVCHEAIIRIDGIHCFVRKLFKRTSRN